MSCASAPGYGAEETAPALQTHAEHPEVQRRLKALFDPSRRPQIVSITHQAARAAVQAPLPDGLHPTVRVALERAGVPWLYRHQATAFDILTRPDDAVVTEAANVALTTGTASGKSLCFTLPVLDALAQGQTCRALFVYPTKALAQDQARKLAALGPVGRGVAIYDGDTPPERRARIRRESSVILSNPDMLHVGILPAHERWAEFLHQLRYVVLDEAHVYRGVFGSHVAQVIRRLRRLCDHYGSAPRYVLASATIAHPQRFAEQLVGLPFTVIDEDAAPHPERSIVLWDPPLEDPDLGTRRSALVEAATIVCEALLAGARVIAFAPTRRAAELMYTAIRNHIAQRPAAADRARAERVLPYRGGYTPQQRRDIERRLFEHELDAVVCTSALELGIDVGALDLAVVVGFPGTVTSLLQRWGRAGRAGRGWAAMVAGADALDQFFMREPERLLSRPVEEAVIDVHNPYILDAHLQAGAYELPIADHDVEVFGEHGLHRAARLAQTGHLRRSSRGLVWASPHAPAAGFSLRTASNRRFTIVERAAGTVLGEVEGERLFRTAHPGAVYLHLGEQYIVRELDLALDTVLVDHFHGGFYTQPKVDKDIMIVGQSADPVPMTGASLSRGQIQVTEQVVAYQRRDIVDRHVIDTVDLDVPEQVFVTEAFWLVLDGDFLERTLQQHGSLDTDDPTSRGRSRLAGSLHAMEHALIAVLPLHAMCDRWDIGGLSTPWHWQTDRATVFVYDGYPGGIGLSRRGFKSFSQLVSDAHALVQGCPCESGCPSCIQSPKCGNLNEPLDKQGALSLLAALASTPKLPQD